MDADAAVDPHDQQQDALENAAQRRRSELVQLLGVALVCAGQAQRDPGAEHVIGEQKRDGEAKDELRRLEPRPAELSALVERPETEAHVGQEGGVKRHRAREGLPEQLLDLEFVLHRRNRDQPQRMIEVMQGHVAEEHEP